MRGLILIGSIALILTCAVASTAQCALKPDQAPEVRGLRLGMTVARMRTLYTSLAPRAADEFGEAQITAGSNNLTPVEQIAFKGIDTIHLDFIDDRLVEFGVTYANLPWKDLNQFISKTSELLKLPSGWSGDENTQTLNCNGLQIRAGRSSWSVGSASNYINFKEVGAGDVLTKRVARKRERQIESFKP